MNEECCRLTTDQCLHRSIDIKHHSLPLPIQCGKLHFNTLHEGPSIVDDQLWKLVAVTVAKECKNVTNEEALTAIRRFNANNFGIFDEMLQGIGTGVYPWAASLNHSCAPNCLVRFYFYRGGPPLLIFVAAREIKPGEELCHSYCDVSLPTSQRRDKLKENYGIDHCNCIRCMDLIETKWPIDIEKSDIKILQDPFYFKNINNNQSDNEVITIDELSLNYLKTYHWPGNIQELRNLIERLSLSISNNKIIVSDVKEHLKNSFEINENDENLTLENLIEKRISKLLSSFDDNSINMNVYDKFIRTVEKPLIENILNYTRGNQIKASSILGLNRNTLRKKISELGVTVRKVRKNSL